MSELYKFFYKKHIRIFLLLLVIPILFGVGCLFDLSYMMEEGEMADSVFAYCSQMQQLIKNIYFLAVIFISCEIFSGEIENGQIRTSLVHMCSRKKLFLKKYFSICFVITIFHCLFWGINALLYCFCMLKENLPIVLRDKSIVVYFQIFSGYLEAFFLCVALAFLVGLFLKKMHSVILLYVLWFSFRYAEEVIGLKNVLVEFTADYLTELPAALPVGGKPFLFSGLLCIAFIGAGMFFFQQKELKK